MREFLDEVALPRVRGRTRRNGEAPWQQESGFSSLFFVGFVFSGAAPVASPDQVASLVFEPDAAGGWSGVNDPAGIRLLASADGMQVSLARGADGPAEPVVRFRYVGYGRGDRRPDQPPAARGLSAGGAELHLDHGAVREWYRNRMDGVEHGFTIDAAPDTKEAGPLHVWVLLETELPTDLTDDGRALVFRRPDGRPALHYDKLVVTDATGARLDAKMVLDGKMLRFVVDDDGAVYPVTIDPLLSFVGWQLAMDDQKRFGERVGTMGDIDGDGTSDIYAHDDDRMYWWTGSTSGPGPSVNFPSLFVHLVEIGDLNGDGLDDMIRCNTGGVTTYLSDGAGDLLPSEGVSFGNSNGTFCGHAGDLNGDGSPDLWAVGPDSLGFGSGVSAWIYLGDGQGTFEDTPIAELPAGVYYRTFSPDTLTSDYSTGDVNGDGYDDFLAGTTTGMQLHYGGPSGITSTPDWSVAGYGRNVTIAGDLNCDRYPDIVATQTGFGDPAPEYPSSIAIFTGGPGTLLTTPLTTMPGFFADWRRAGLPVAAAGDVNGDDCADLVVGEPQWPQGSDARGRVLVYYGRQTINQVTSDDDADWEYANTSFLADPWQLGYSVSAAGDVNFDGYGDIVVGEPGYENPEINDGRVLVFYGAAETLEQNTTPHLAIVARRRPARNQRQDRRRPERGRILGHHRRRAELRRSRR